MFPLIGAQKAVFKIGVDGNNVMAVGVKDVESVFEHVWM